MKLSTLSAVVGLLVASGLAHAQTANPFTRPVPKPVAPVAAPAPVAAAPAAAEVELPPPPPVDNTIREEVQGSRIGTVNGLRIYRGNNTYVFENAKERKLERVPAHSARSSGDAGAAPARKTSTSASTARSPATPKKLPSMVGKSAPKQ